MADYIKRDDALRAFENEDYDIFSQYADDGFTFATVERVLLEIPTADVVERKKGKWTDHSGDGYVECPFCDSATNCDGNIEELHFCFSCGAEMESE